jgi:hypothetical protein
VVAVELLDTLYLAVVALYFSFWWLMNMEAVAGNSRSLLFPTRLLTSEDEYKWYWHQMIYFPETINTISTTNTIPPTHSLVSS